MNKICISDCIKLMLEMRARTYVCFQNEKGIFYTCQIKNDYIFRGHIDGDMKYTEIIKYTTKWSLYKYYPKILTYSNEYTNEPVIYTQEYDHPMYINLWFL
jgi:hypothetical protein